MLMHTEEMQEKKNLHPNCGIFSSRASQIQGFIVALSTANSWLTMLRRLQVIQHVALALLALEVMLLVTLVCGKA